MDFFTDLMQRRGEITPGGNPHRFIERVGGREVHMSFYEPDPSTFREAYYYNTRQNILFKLVSTIDRCCRTPRKVFYWKRVSEF